MTRTHTKTMVVAVGTVIRHCTVEGNQYSLARQFSFTHNCYRYNCECHSDGSWECPSKRSEYICNLQIGLNFLKGPSKKMTIIVSDNVRACVASGNEYPLGRPFSFMDGCIRYNCECHSDGSWECPAERAEDICQHGRDRLSITDPDHTRTETTRTNTRTMVVAVGTVIRHCTAEGNQYPVGRPFSFTENCFRFNCECHSDGSWECPSERSEYVCRLHPGKRIVRGPSKKMTIIVSDNVRACVSGGKDYPLGRPFSFMDGCIRYNCDCHSDGSWECPADRAEDTCQHGRDRLPTTGTDRTRPEATRTHTRTMVVAVGTVIRHCTVEGSQYPVGRPFSFTENCFRFNCECRSDGSWECPSERSEYICELQPGQRIVRGPSKKMTIIVSDNVRACVARGNQYQLARPFSFMDGCIRYNCECHSDGSWECPADRAEDTCQHGRDRLPTTDRDHTRRENTTERTHTRTMVVAVGTVIRHCTVEGNQYPVGRPFSFTENCFRFNCECQSDGSWECPSERSEYICRLRPGQRIVRGPSKKMTIIVNDNARACIARGNEYPLGRPFSFRDGCFRYNCECHSDGSWECPADRAEDTCQHGRDRLPTTDPDNTRTETARIHARTMVVAVGTLIRHCTVEGNQYPVGRPFSFNQNCFRFNCECHSDGSWECPSERSKYICRPQPGQRIVRGPSKKMTIIVSDNVRACVARGNEYPLGRPFSFLDGCIRYNCDCHSDGSSECPADRAEDTCQHGRDRQPTTNPDRTRTETNSDRTHTRTMVVAVGTVIRHCTVEGSQYPVGRPFSFTENCFRFKCECHSDGSWECPSERSEYVCSLKPGQRIVRGPSKKMTIIVSDNAQACVARGNEYPLARPFSFRDGCFRYNCECHSDGSWECPAERAENICRHGQDGLGTPGSNRIGVEVPTQRTHTRTMVVAVGTEIKHCTVEGNQYPVGRPFSFTENCFRFNCECNSDGSWECPSESSEYICELQPGQQIVRGPSKKMTIIVSDNVRSCVARGNEYTLGRPFSFMDGCIKYHCDCHSDGSWECPADKAEDTCHDKLGSEMTTDKPTAITEKTHTKTMVVAVGTQLSDCTADGKQYAVGHPFSFTQSCFRFNCECHLDGSWECPSENTEYTCQLEPGQERVRGPSKKMTIIVSDNLRSCIAKGNEYALDQPFSFMDGCIRYNCECHSDGSWECPAEEAENTCQQDRANTTEDYHITSGKIDTRTMVVAVGTEITHCTAEGNQYPVGRPFSFTEGCFRFNCECYSNGSWNCPSDRSEFTCPLEPGKTIIRGPGKKMTIVMSDNVQACIARGNEYFLGQPFSFTEGCFKYHCECHVDGSWECSANEAEDICNQDRQVTSDDKNPNKKMTIVISNNPLSCVARGNEYTLGRPFSFMDGCYRYHCDCRTDGSWECPADRAENVCQGERTDKRTTGTDHTRHRTSSEKTHTRTVVVAVGTTLRHCTIEGRQYSIGHPFSFDEGCFRFNCDCHPDGSWECPSERSEYTCQLKPGQQMVRGPSKKMTIIVSDNVRACVVKRNEYPLGRPFSFMDGCIKYNCKCNSDGSWECPADNAEDTCPHGQGGDWTSGGYHTGEETVDTRSHTRTMVVAVGTQLSHCTVGSDQYPTERPFSFTEGCFRFNCVCNSDGSWECPSERSEYICPLKPGQIVVRGPSKKMTIVVSNDMRYCQAMGYEYPLGLPFSFKEGCFKYNCECHSDGSWDCPAGKAENICQRGRTEQRTVTERKSHTRSMVIPVGTQLKFCTAQGNKYPLGRSFSFTDECFRFNCECHQDGSWECPSEKSQYTCPLKPGKRIVRGPSKSMIIVVSNKLDACTVRGQDYTLNQSFSFSDGCYTYQCECHSDGSWDCPADQAVDRCGHTRDRQPTREETTVKKSMSRSIVVPVGTAIGFCLVNEIEYTLSSTFSFEDDCFRYKCECHSDASWECPGDLAEYICHQRRGHVTRAATRSFYVITGDNIISCLANGNEYPLLRPFQFTVGCFRYSCQCGSDGSWECPAVKVEDTCQHTSNGQQTIKETVRRSHTKSLVLPVGVRLEHCLTEGHPYALGLPFSFTEGCFRFNCDCHSNASWECPSERSEYICQLQPGQKIVRAPSKSLSIVARDNARSCSVKGSEFRLGQAFSFTEGCFIYKCECHTDGSWECPADNAVDRCRRTIEGQPSRGGPQRREENRNRRAHTRSMVVSVGTEIRYCIAQEMHFTLGQQFSFREGCFEFHCLCHWNGSWDCPAERSEYKCKLEPGQQIVRAPSKSMRIVVSDDVRACTANGVDHPLGQPFSFMDGCFIFNCDCHPDGSWECPEDRSVDRCHRTPGGGQRNRDRVEDTIDRESVSWASVNLPIAVKGQVVAPGSAIRSCGWKDKTYSLGSTFSFSEDCYRYKCTCNTDGSWQCPGHLATYSCPPQPERKIVRVPSRAVHIIVGANLRTCTANRVEHDLGRTFVFNEGCFTYNCICHSDGSWECPVDQTVDRCRLAGESQIGTNRQKTGGGGGSGHRSTGESREQTSHTRSLVVSDGTEIKYCIAHEMKFILGQPFSFREGCFKFHCQCHLNGSWDCPAERSEYKCKPEPGQQIVRAPSKSMRIVVSDDVRACTANGVDHPLDQPFSFMDGCFIFNCECHPDGSWECPEDMTVDRCRRTPDVSQGNRSRGGENTSNGQQTSHGHERTGYDQDISWEQPVEPVHFNFSVHPAPRENVKTCTVRGVDYPLGVLFSFTINCYKYNCECQTDGSSSCHSGNSEYVCSENGDNQKPSEEINEFETLSSGKIHRSEATMCTADGKRYPLNQAFSFTVGCYRYNCECRKDGSWECPGHRVENTCRSLEGRSTGQVKRRNIQVVISNNLRTCTVKGVEFPLDHTFSFTDNCVKYNCHCFFDGTWDCPPERIEHACPTSGGIQHQLITSPRLQRSHDSPLRSCVVEGVEYASGSSFNFKAFCYRFKCQCFSDGSWECPSSKAEFICRDVPLYQYTTNRTTGEQLSSQGIVISPRSTPKYCSAYGLYHKLNQSFIVTDRCFRLRCHCHSDGSWECPSHQAIYFCPTNSRHVHRAASRSLHITVSSRPTMCQVKGNQYGLGQPFLYMDGCFKYHCICNIDGSWACPSKRTQDICPANSTEESRMQRASAVHGILTRQQVVWFCMVKGKRYPVGRPFTYAEGCIRYTCDCKRDGTWNCPAHKSKNMCQGQGRTEHRTQQTGCTVMGQTYYTKDFRYTDQCILYTCTCTNGSYNCPAELSTTIC